MACVNAAAAPLLPVLFVELLAVRNEDFKLDASSCTNETTTPAESKPPVGDKLIEFAEFGMDKETAGGVDELVDDEEPKLITEKLAVIPPVEMVTVFTVVDPDEVPAFNIPKSNGAKASNALLAWSKDPFADELVDELEAKRSLNT